MWWNYISLSLSLSLSLSPTFLPSPQHPSSPFSLCRKLPQLGQCTSLSLFYPSSILPLSSSTYNTENRNSIWGSPQVQLMRHGNKVTCHMRTTLCPKKNSNIKVNKTASTASPFPLVLVELSHDQTDAFEVYKQYQMHNLGNIAQAMDTVHPPPPPQVQLFTVETIYVQKGSEECTTMSSWRSPMAGTKQGISSTSRDRRSR